MKIKIDIEKESQGKFTLTWKDFPDEELSLDFNPLIQAFDVADGIVLHWQSRPKSLPTKQGRCWGVYDVTTDTYFVGIASSIPLFKAKRCKVLDIPEAKISSVPTAIVYFPGLKARESNGMILVS